MGAERSKARFRKGLVLDAGALIAFERAENQLVGFVEEAALLTSDPDDMEALADPAENLVLVSV